ncbi:tetratricopeptide repeat protein [Okeania sp.]|uniref:tetratricopeptide repeat protein n=1 Tax=Okeania sp. TaxID=3100323 RepID=UPI002B4B3955|nr:tetratricopeptide repeat protein [Okeania sp.]MEB3340188.1 tetratricopeptide repeat protein [Okeania sp.]
MNFNLVEPYINLGDLFSQQQQWQAAIEHYNQAIQLNPNKGEIYHKLGEALLQLKRWDEAVIAYKKATELNPNFPWYYPKLGEALLQLKRWDEAVDAYRKVIAIEPNFPWSYNKLGDAFMELKNWEEAINAYRNFIKIKPNFPWPYNKLAQAFIKLKKWEEAVSAYRHFIKLKPDIDLAYKNLGDALIKLENWAEVLAAYRQAVNINPKLYTELGEKFIKLEKWSEAVEIYQNAIEIHPNNYWYYYNLGKALSKLSRYEEAITAYQQAIEINPNLHFAHHNLGNTFLQLKRWNEAISAYRQAIKIKPDSDWSYYGLGEALTKQKKWSDAVAIYQQAISYQPTEKLYKKLGDVLQTLGQLEAAITNYQKTLQIFPESFSSYEALVDIYMRQEKWSEARKCFQKVLEIKPNYEFFGIKQVSIKEKVIALTYDDGPNPPYTNQILNILDFYQAQATFFALGKNLKNHLKLGKLILAKGHELANHSYSHLDLSQESPELIKAEIAKTDEILQQLGVTHKIRFRPPFGLSSFSLIDMILEMKKKMILWNIDSKDYVKENDWETIANYVIENARPGAIILMHDNRTKTVKATEIILETLTVQGYKFKTVSEILEKEYP